MIDARWAGWIVGIAALGYVAADKLDMLPRKHTATKIHDPFEQTDAPPRPIKIVTETALSPSESIKVVAIPDPLLNDPMFDSRCLIYANQELRTAALTCLPEASINP